MDYIDIDIETSNEKSYGEFLQEQAETIMVTYPKPYDETDKNYKLFIWAVVRHLEFQRFRDTAENDTELFHTLRGMGILFREVKSNIEKDCTSELPKIFKDTYDELDKKISGGNEK